MQLSSLVSLGALLSMSHALVLRPGDANFWSGRGTTQKVMSGNGNGSPNKYFHEATFHAHYDGRFGAHQLEYEEQQLALKMLARSYLSRVAEIGVQTWLMHGSLLGWWWNKQILPWDSDIDVQVSESSMHYLAAYYNMSIFHFTDGVLPGGRKYMLEVNPNYKIREQTDTMNVIDARWIDTETGLFIDITAARYNLTHPEGEGMLSCKGGHEFRDTYLYPLRKTHFEGAPANIPYRFKDFLVSEYGNKALSNKDFHDHLFDDASMQWLPKPKAKAAQKKELAPAKKNRMNYKEHVSSQRPSDKPQRRVHRPMHKPRRGR